MKKETLRSIVANLKDTLSTIYNADNKFSKIRSIYTEFLVAYELAKQGYEVQIGWEREITSADLYLPDEEIRVEVKSGLYDKDGWAHASFKEGSQIVNNKFDYCIFVTFDSKYEYRVNEMFVLTLQELRSIGKFERNVAKFQNNTHLLIKGPDVREYRSYIRKSSDRVLSIELALMESPEKYNRAWDRIIQFWN